MVKRNVKHNGDVTDVTAIRIPETGTIFNRLWQPFIAVWVSSSEPDVKRTVIRLRKFGLV